jgi:hypothetical protein
MSFGISHLERPLAPWILRIEGTADADLVDRSLTDIGITTRVLSGTRMQTRGSLLDEFSAQLAFPDRFGRNWDALADCLTDLEWLQGLSYGLIVSRANHLLENEPDTELDLFVRLIEDVAMQWSIPVNNGEAWDRPAKPFHLLLHDVCTGIENGYGHFSNSRSEFGTLTLEE